MKALRTALINIRRMPYKSMVAVFMISLTFFIGYSFSLFALGSERVLNFFESQPQVIAFFNIQAEEKKVKEVVKHFSDREEIKQIKLVSKEEALQYYRQDKKNNPLLLELVTADILPASIEISTANPEQLTQAKAELLAYDQIDEVVLQEDIVNKLVYWTNTIRLVGLVTMVALATASLLIITTIISLKVSYKKRSIGILKFIGANTGFIVTPFIWEGFIYGALGSALGWSLMYGGYLYLNPWLKQFLGDIISFPLSWEFFALQAGAGTIAGLFFGGFSSILAVNRLLRK